jgi:hypothetical protein
MLLSVTRLIKKDGFHPIVKVFRKSKVASLFGGKTWPPLEVIGCTLGGGQLF